MFFLCVLLFIYQILCSFHNVSIGGGGDGGGGDGGGGGDVAIYINDGVITCPDPCWIGTNCDIFNCSTTTCQMCTMFPMWSQDIFGTGGDNTSCVSDTHYPWSFDIPGDADTLGVYTSAWPSRIPTGINSTTLFLSWRINGTARIFGVFDLFEVNECTGTVKMVYDYGSFTVTIALQMSIYGDTELSLELNGMSYALLSETITTTQSVVFPVHIDVKMTFTQLVQHTIVFRWTGNFTDILFEGRLLDTVPALPTPTGNNATIKVTRPPGILATCPNSGFDPVDFFVPDVFFQPLNYGVSNRTLSDAEIGVLTNYGSALFITHTCGGLSCNSSLVCSGHGSCVAQDVCQCTDPWTGASCGIRDANCTNTNTTCPTCPTCPLTNSTCGNTTTCPTCPATNSTCPMCPLLDGPICSGGCVHGNCTEPNNCTCDTQWEGSDCGTPICENVCQNGGLCVVPDVCSCIDSWFGDICQNKTVCPNITQPITCFGFFPTNTSVCGGFGTCIELDVCVCDILHSGTTCYIPLCTQHPCSVHGNCTDVNTCTCDDYFTGDQCDIPLCENCVNGNCITGMSNTCDCDVGYENENCTQSICTSGCENGVCTSPDICTCFSGFDGFNCSINKNVTSNSCINDLNECLNKTKPECTLFCDNGGLCIFENETQFCFCANGWNGTSCTIPICQHDCDHGICSTIVPGECICEYGWTGYHCDIAQCPGGCINGECNSPSVCTCQSGWSGINCNTPICIEPCQNGGFCTSPECCKCADNFFGVACQNRTVCDNDTIIIEDVVPTCFGLFANNSNVCNGHGTCEDTDTCCCDDLFIAPLCIDVAPICPNGTANETVPVCFGIPADCDDNGHHHHGHNPNHFNLIGKGHRFHGNGYGFGHHHHNKVCNGHGVCIADDVCVCDDGFVAPTCLQNVPMCFRESALNYDRVCSGHGKCVNDDECKCSPPYFGEECECHKHGFGKKKRKHCEQNEHYWWN